MVIVPDQSEYRELGLENEQWDVIYYRRRLSHLGRWFFDRFTLNKITARFRPDVVWGMGNLCFIDPPRPQAISIQNPYLFYGTRNTGRLSFIDRLWCFFLRRHFRRQLPATDVVFCQTATMAERMRSVWDYQGKCVVSSKAVSNFSTLEPTGRVPDALRGNEDKFKLLYLARYYPHKGLEVLLEVMERYADELADTVTVITIAADQHPNAARLLNTIRKKGLEDRIINVGPLDQQELADYYAACDCLVMPTRLESFSGTYLEAMHFGLPILTSDLDFAREVCGDAALYFDPWSPESIKTAILRVKNHHALAQELIEKGHERLNTGFGRTWENIAMEMLYNLEQLVHAQDSHELRKR